MAAQVVIKSYIVIYSYN